ncbi:unnamed protein product, partial [Allacma fusca]
MDSSETKANILDIWAELFKVVLLNLGDYLDRLCDIVSPPLIPCLMEETYECGSQSNLPVENNGFYLWNQDFYEMIYKPTVKFYQ